MKKIAITASKSKTQYFVNQAYIKYVADAGFIPIVVAPESMATSTKICDGLLLPGGIDLDPLYYDEDNIMSYSTDPEKDAFERAILQEFVALEKPVFGICRGMQLIIREFLLSIKEDKYNEWFTFYQNVNSHNQTGSLSIDRHIPTHYVSADMAGLYGKPSRIKRIPVNSMHHQCLALSDKGRAPEVLKKDLTVLAWTRRGFDKKDKEIVVEAFRINNWPSKVLAVQWHPEELSDIELLRNFFSPKRKKNDHKPDKAPLASKIADVVGQ
ncbi:hypothetical protein DRN34_02865 [Thermococci archaeon]|nr:MAG: hypothetical protein DRN34_02865 [Thermococci archaeon]